MTNFKFPALVLTVPYVEAADVSELLQKYNPQVISVIDTGSNTVFDVMSPEVSLNIPEIARLIIEHEQPEVIEAEIITITNAANLNVGTRIVNNEDELTEGDILL